MAAPQAPRAQQAPPKPSTSPNVVLAALVARYGAKKALAMLGSQGAASAAAPVAAEASFAAPSMLLPSGATAGATSATTTAATAPAAATGVPLAGVAALLAPAAIAYGMGTWKKGHGDLGSDRERYLNQSPAFAALTAPQKKDFTDAATKAGGVYQTKNEIDPTNPLAAQGREMPHYNFAKYLKPEGGIWGNGDRQQLGDAKSLAIQRGFYVPTIEEMEASPYVKGDKKAELVNALKLLQGGGSNNNKVGGGMSNVPTKS